MSKKDQCKEIMGRIFGPATANLVNAMSEEECVDKCKQKASAMLGPDKAKEFDKVR